MRLLFWIRYSLRSLRRSGRRAIFALICIAVGVASVVALQTASLTVQAALLSNVRAANGGDVSVSSEESPMAPQDLAIFERLQRQGLITTWTAIYSIHATAVGPVQQLVPFDVQVVSSPPYPLGGEPTFVSPGNGSVKALLSGPGDVLITSVLAEELGAHIGDKMVVNSVGGKGLHVTIRGVLAETNLQHSAVMTVNKRDAGVLTDSAPRYTAAYADVSGSASVVATDLRRHFPVATVQTVQESLQATQTEVHDFRQFMLLVGLLALLVAGIGILNAMQSILAWRRLEIAMLKAVGFPQTTLYGLFGGEAILLGLGGGVAGSLVGALASKVITEAFARALAIQVTFVLDIGTLLGGIVLGAGATLIFAILPIVRAAGFRPLEILREGTAVPSARGAVQTLALIVLVVVLFAALAAAIMGDIVLAAEFVAGAFGAFVAITGMFAVIVGGISRVGSPRSPIVGLPVLAILLLLTVLSIARVPSLAALLALATLVWAATMLPPRWLLPLVIATRALSRRRARTSVTLTAFLVGVLAMSVTLTVALSLRGQINDALASNGTANLVAVANPSNEGAVLRETRRLPGVKNSSIVTVVSTTPTRVNGRPVAEVIGATPSSREGDPEDRTFLLGGVGGLNLRSGAQPTRITLTNGRWLGPQDSGTNNILVRDQLQGFPWGLSVGDTVTLRDAGSGNTQTATIAGFYARARRRGFASFFQPPIFGDRSLALRLGGADAQSVVSLTVDPNNLTHDAATLQQAVPGILVLDIGDLTRVIDTILGELLNLLAVITALALGAGLAVVGNGVALSMLERRREIALFKAIGFSPASVLQFVLVENALAGTLAGALAVLAVVAALAIFSKVALNQAIGFDPIVAMLILLLAAALAVVTSYLAARAPIRVRPIEALRNE